MVSEHMQRRIEDEEIEGWQLHEEKGDKVVMIKRKYGGLGGHALIALLTIWWTFGIGNVIYASYKYFVDSDKKVIREEDVKPAESPGVFVEEEKKTTAPQQDDQV